MSFASNKLKEYDSLNREDYFQTNEELSKALWDKEKIPTVGDIANFMSGERNEKIEKIFEFFDNRDDFTAKINRVNHSYSEEESEKHIASVRASNSDDISEAGYFYFLLMASADDFVIQEKKCKSEGILFKKEDITEEIYNYRIKFMYINEIKQNMRYNYDKFMRWMDEKGFTEIHVRSPLTCECAKNHGICKRCAGALPADANVGLFSTLMVTESATQGALSSMNKGKKENINKILNISYRGDNTWEAICLWINDIVESIRNDNVSARFYEIALLSRVRKVKGNFIVSGLKQSINYSNNYFGQYIQNRSNKELKNMIRKRSFNDNSFKLKIAMNDFKE